MVIALMQPYFLPYVGHYQLIQQTDLWVVFDTVQYIRRGWMNRNRVLHPQQGWQYLTVPVAKHDRDTTIDQIRLAADVDWPERMLRRLDHYRRFAPYFEPTIALLRDCWHRPETSLSRLNVNCLEAVCHLLGIRFNYVYLSRLELDLGPVTEPGDWALRVCEAVGASEYVNPPGGRDLYSSDRFASSGVRLTIQEPVEFRYSCAPFEFVPNLSMIDILMWNSIETIRTAISAVQQPPAQLPLAAGIRGA